MLSPATNPVAADVVATPPALARMVVEHFVPYGTTNCLDPCRGVEPYPFYTALDRHYVGRRPKGFKTFYAEIEEGRDFFESYGYGVVSWIVTNPPWSKIRPFLAHAMTLADDVVFVAPLTNFVTRARLRDVRKAKFGYREALLLPQPPAPWPSSGFQLCAMHVQRGWTGPLTLTDKTWWEDDR